MATELGRITSPRISRTVKEFPRDPQEVLFEIQVRITKHDSRYHRSNCPIANSIKREFGPSCRADVNKGIIAFTRGGIRYWFEAPFEAIQFQQAYDHQENPDGFTLVLRRHMLRKWVYSVSIPGRHVIQHDGRGSGPRGPRIRKW